MLRKSIILGLIVLLMGYMLGWAGEIEKDRKKETPKEPIKNHVEGQVKKSTVEKITATQFNSRWGNKYTWTDGENQGEKGIVEKEEVKVLDGKSVAEAEWSEIGGWQKNVLSIQFEIVNPCDKYIAINDKDNFHIIQTPSGVEIEVLYDHQNKNNVLIVPGAFEPAYIYRALASALFQNKTNVFVMNYYNLGGSKKVDPWMITEETHAANLKDALHEIKSRYNISNPILVGHNRGAGIIQVYLEQVEEQQKAVLIAPRFGENIGPTQLKATGWFIHRGGNYILEKKAFERIYGPIYNNDEMLQCHISLLAEAPQGVRFDNIKYSEYKQLHFIKVIIMKDDERISPEYQLSNVKKLMELPTMKNLEYIIVDGFHSELINKPDIFPKLILEMTNK